VVGKKVYLVVNVASKCERAAKNYKWLVQIYNEFRNDNFEILAFPSNQFGKEPGDAATIEKKVREYGVQFPIMEKCEVNGAKCHKAYSYLRRNSELYDQKKGKLRDIPNNFAKFLVGGDG